MNTNEKWADKIISRWDKSFKYRWTVFNNILADLQDPSHCCLDVGCGENSELVDELKFKLKTGTDLILPNDKKSLPIPFIQADLYNLPFKNNSFNLVILRFVVEHIQHPEKSFAEIQRILNPEGKVLIMTTNICSPLIFIPKLLPYSLRKKIILKLFGAADDDIFPTYHRLNSRNAFLKNMSSFKIQKWKYIQDVNFNRKWLFNLFFIWHLITKWFRLSFLRTNIITLIKNEKTN